MFSLLLMEQDLMEREQSLVHGVGLINNMHRHLPAQEEAENLNCWPQIDGGGQVRLGAGQGGYQRKWD